MLASYRPMQKKMLPSCSAALLQHDGLRLDPTSEYPCVSNVRFEH